MYIVQLWGSEKKKFKHTKIIIFVELQGNINYFQPHHLQRLDRERIYFKFFINVPILDLKTTSNP